MKHKKGHVIIGYRSIPLQPKVQLLLVSFPLSEIGIVRDSGKFWPMKRRGVYWETPEKDFYTQEENISLSFGRCCTWIWCLELLWPLEDQEENQPEDKARIPRIAEQKEEKNLCFWWYVEPDLTNSAATFPLFLIWANTFPYFFRPYWAGFCYHQPRAS